MKFVFFEYIKREDETTGEDGLVGPVVDPIEDDPIEDANVEIEVILFCKKCSTFNEVIKTD